MATQHVLTISALVVLAMLLQPLQSSAETEMDARYDARASVLAKKRAWPEHSHVVAQWIRRSPDSARAWYHEGLLLRALKRSGSVAAFETAVKLDPSSSIMRQALCVQLYKEGQLNESLVCAEHIPLNEMRDTFAVQTFGHPIIVAGVADWEQTEGRSEPAALYVQPQAPVRKNENAFVDSQAQDQMARSEAKELARLIDLRDKCAALWNSAQRMGEKANTGVGAMAAMPFGTAAFRVCAQYDQALKERQYYEVLRSQQQ